MLNACLLYTSDAADERSSVDLGGRRIIKKTTSRLVTAGGRHPLHTRTSDTYRIYGETGAISGSI